MEDSLEEQFATSVSEIKTDEYTMSVGEIVNMYRDGDLTISPVYQRYFRWNNSQKSAFIESLILGIPIPSIFVAQNSDGKWDVIDGLQRISSILQFIGMLEDKDPLVTNATKFLPALEGKNWETIGPKFRRIIKRRRISVFIIDTSANNSIKYELFQRLNTNGSKLTEQEVRNVVILMANKDLFNIINEMSENKIFLTVINNLSDNRKQKQIHKELLSELFILMTIDPNKINANVDLAPFLTDAIINNQQLKTKEQIEEIEQKILRVLKEIVKVLGNDASKIFDLSKQAYQKRFSRPIYEITFMYTWKHITEIKKDPNILIDYHKKLPSTELFKMVNKRGFRPTERIKRIILTNGDSSVSNN